MAGDKGGVPASCRLDLITKGQISFSYPCHPCNPWLRIPRSGGADADVAWEAWHTGFGEFLVSKRDGGADGRRVGALAVAEPGADREPSAVGQAGQQGAEAPLVAAGAGEMSDDDGLGVVERLDLQKRGRPAGDLFRAGLAQHESLAAERFDARQLGP